MNNYQMFIAGQWTTSQETIPIINPFNNKILGYMPEATDEQIENALRSAWQAQNIMKNLAAHKRAEILFKTADFLKINREKMTSSIISESGKPLKWATTEVSRAIENLKFCAIESMKIHGETVPMDASRGSENRMGFWMRFPIGPVAAISPFNFPLNLVIHKIAPAVAAGNPVILKPASKTPGPAQLLVSLLLEAGLPDQAINLIFGSGAKVGEALVKDARVSKITFTGSPSIGKRIKQISGLKKITLELGSNSAVIIDDDANIDLALERCLEGSFAYSGQVCISVQRIYVHDSLYESFTKDFIGKINVLKIGDPAEKSTDIGPLISKTESERVEDWVKEATDNGADILCGGKRDRNFYEPTVLTNVKNEMKVICQEAFGPIVSLIPFNNYTDSLSMLNNSIYGLQAGVFTKNITHAFDAVKQLNVGGIIINDVPSYRADHMPYGGVKESGIGREGARFAIEEMTNIKMIVFNL